MPFYVLPLNEGPQAPSAMFKLHRTRAKRSAPHGLSDDGVYIGSIGVPRGVPDEFKACHQVTAGFESFLFWWATVNKHVDWINYIYYNQQRFVNYTWDGMHGNVPQPWCYQHHHLLPEGQKRMSHDAYQQRCKPPSALPYKSFLRTLYL